jgi:hypothetical protein
MTVVIVKHTGYILEWGRSYGQQEEDVSASEIYIDIQNKEM